MSRILSALTAGQLGLCFMTAEQQDKTRQKLRNLAITGDDEGTLRQASDELLSEHQQNRSNTKWTPKFEPGPRITVTMTTCKRLDLFIRTMTSFLTCCEDAYRIQKWLVVDDGSSDSDISTMKTMFPFLTFIDKKERGIPVGHAHSMNLLWFSGLVDDCDYVFHLEDDWQFFIKDEYLTRCIDSDRDQVFINRNYAETVLDLNSVGGHFDPDFTVWDHDYDDREPRSVALLENETGYTSHSYWPGFSLRPALLRRWTISHMAPFVTDPSVHFEMEFATRWEGSTAFLPEINSWHIGRLTRDRHNQQHTLNAYELNGQGQFGNAAVSMQKTEEIVAPAESVVSDPVTSEAVAFLQETKEKLAPTESATTHVQLHNSLRSRGADRVSLAEFSLESDMPALSFETILINLKRRPDRLENFRERNKHVTDKLNIQRFDAIDGRELQFTHHLSRLVKHTDFDFHRYMIACALSHMKSMYRLVHIEGIDAILFLEDDGILVSDFVDKLQRALTILQLHHSSTWKLLWLGTHKLPNSAVAEEDTEVSEITVRKYDAGMMAKNSMGGTHGYVLHRRGAEEILNQIQSRGMHCAIDWELWACPEAYVCNPPIVLAPHPGCESLDTDIQKPSENNCLFEKQSSTSVDRTKYHLIAAKQLANVDIVPVDISVWLLGHPNLLKEYVSTELPVWQHAGAAILCLEIAAPRDVLQAFESLADGILALSPAESSVCFVEDGYMIIAFRSEIRDRMRPYFCFGPKYLDLDLLK